MPKAKKPTCRRCGKEIEVRGNLWQVVGDNSNTASECNGYDHEPKN